MQHDEDEDSNIPPDSDMSVGVPKPAQSGYTYTPAERASPVPTLPTDYEDPTIDSLVLLHSKQTADSFEEYEEALIRFVSLKYSVLGLGSPMRDLNRRFSHLARQHGCRVIEACRMLARQNAILLLHHKGNLIALPRVFSQTVAAMTFKDADLANQFQLALLERTLSE